MKNNTKGTLILLLTAAIWGSAFVAQTTASKNLSALTFTGLRSIVAVVFLLVAILVRDKFIKKEKSNISDVQKKKKSFKAGIVCGVVLTVASNLQQLGITVYPDGVAASGRAGFLTATYVVMVAASAGFVGKKLQKNIIAAVVGCIAGMYMLCLSNGFSGFYFGDVLLLLCAVSFTFHILVIDRYADMDSMVMSLAQFCICAVISIGGALLFEEIRIENIKLAGLSILYAGVMSSGVAYTLQMVGQKYAEPAVTSIVMSLESVFAVLTGWLLLNERLSTRELIGCVLVFGAVILAQVSEFKKDKTV